MSWQNHSAPRRMMGLKYVNMMMGAFIWGLTRLTTSMTCTCVQCSHQRLPCMYCLDLTQILSILESCTAAQSMISFL